MLSNEQFEARRRSILAEGERIGRIHRVFFPVLLVLTGLFALVTLAGAVGLVWWLWTGRHPFGPG